jgi:hypothetical protein
MQARHLLDDPSKPGFVVEACAGKVVVQPASGLTDVDRTIIRRYQHALVVELVNPPVDSGL